MGLKKFDIEGRVLMLEFDDFYMVNVYVPNAKPKLARITERLEFNKAFKEYLENLKSKKMVIVVGDFNVAHNEIDLSSPEKKKPDTHGFSKPERDAFTELLDCGFVDTWRELNPEKVKYTWWDARHK